MVKGEEKVVVVKRKPSKKRHFWCYRDEIIQVKGNPQKGDVVSVYEGEKFIGKGFWNPASSVRLRIFSPEGEDFDVPFLKKRILTAYQHRKALLPEEEDFRLVYGESDSLPGVVIDKYQNCFVLQTYSYGADLRKDKIIKALCEIFPVQGVFEKNDFSGRTVEGLERKEGLLYGEIPEEVIISENGAKFYVNIKEGQKTGYYFDQRLTRRRVREMSAGKEVLDVFTYTGSFSINACLGGAKSSLGIDGSQWALNLARKNAELNKVSDRCQFLLGNAFNLLRELYRARRRFDIVVLDPPPFIKTLKDKEDGFRGYRDINLQAMRLLRSGGILFTSTCSHYFFWQDFLECLVSAAEDAQRDFRIIGRLTQGPDHPIILSMPESEYLRCFILEVY
jgi:23S rRNA (cytosine1962-C5)-methyltransferase|uniref:Class I SAM-dependent rRNA methyltransferase n=1 Tax=candidate division WOR-3 bacterium TaxID=2052148 RepID=A0A7C3UVR4_UNCW3